VGNWGVTANADGTLTGYAWSENIGWIKFGGLSSFPSGSGTTAANAAFSGMSLTGWARACAGTAAGDCSSMTDRTDGWDGWIALSGTNYGPTLASGHITGYSWGDVNVGWISWDGSNYSIDTTWLPCTPGTTYACTDGTHSQDTCTLAVTDCQVSPGASGWFCAADTHQCTQPPPPSCSDGCTGGNALHAKPTLVTSGGTSVVSWQVQDATSCTVTGNGNTWTGVSGSHTTNSISGNAATYRLSCTGAGGTLQASVTISVSPKYREL
jgi:hypothetical protein